MFEKQASKVSRLSCFRPYFNADLCQNPDSDTQFGHLFSCCNSRSFRTDKGSRSAAFDDGYIIAMVQSVSLAPRDRRNTAVTKELKIESRFFISPSNMIGCCCFWVVSTEIYPKPLDWRFLYIKEKPTFEERVFSSLAMCGCIQLTL